jgi:2-polyprenyl-3-methyl-5-hydroxy-6-metoxy-1,4-benzoquinol methylase
VLSCDFGVQEVADVAGTEGFRCLGCGDFAEHEVVIRLGPLPLGNSLVEPAPTYPLNLAFCRRCTLLQVREPIPGDALIAQNLYFTSASPSLLRHGHAMAEHLIGAHRLDQRSLVVEIGSNDGTLLKDFEQRGIPVLGIEPIAHSAELARTEHGVETIVELFTDELARRLKTAGRAADLIIGNYLLELIPNLEDFIVGLRTLLKPDNGIAVFEVPYVRSMIEQGRFDGIAHLRLTWFSVTSLDRIFRKQGLVLVDAQWLAQHRGGTLRFTVAASPTAKASAAVAALLQQEARAGVTSPDFYRAFADRIHSSCERLRAFLRHAQLEHKRIAGYGAGIKASMLLNVARLDGAYLEYVVDGNPQRHGRSVPGVGLPIHSPSKLLDSRPDYALLLALDFADEIIDQQAEYRRSGGQFIIPVPELRII